MKGSEAGWKRRREGTMTTTKPIVRLALVDETGGGESFAWQESDAEPSEKRGQSSTSCRKAERRGDEE